MSDVAPGSGQRHPSTRPVPNGPRVMVVDPDASPGSAEPWWLRTIRRVRHVVGSLFFSFLFHTILLVVLALVALNWYHPPGNAPIVAEISNPPNPSLARDDAQTPLIEITIPDDSQSLLEQASTDQSLSTDMTSPSPYDQADQAPSERQSVFQNTAPATAVMTMPTGGGLTGRSRASRARLAAARGGSAESERAVELGLEWLAEHQFADGSWRLGFQDGPCGGQCRNPGTEEQTTAATGLALLAYLGAGYTHHAGKYQRQVQAGIDYILSRKRETYYGTNLQAEGNMYAQGIATLALAEAYAMTNDPELAKTVDLAKHYIVTAQHSRGGWRYIPGSPGDMTVTGWQVMALKSCELSDLTAPRETWKKVDQFLGDLSQSGGCYFGYMSAERSPTPTAIGLLLRIYLGWNRERDELRTGVDYLLGLGRSNRDIYFNYYATMVLHHYGGDAFETWNAQMRDWLVAQQRTQGHERGSWYFDDEHARSGGRLYTTCMAIMILEVYYRYLPLYERTVPVASE